jgi:hypothetical protein
MHSFSGNCTASVPISTFMCLWAIYICIPRIGSTYFLQQNKANRSWEYINRSQTHECGNWDCGRAQFLFWEYLFRIFGIGSLQCISGFQQQHGMSYIIIQPCNKHLPVSERFLFQSLVCVSRRHSKSERIIEKYRLCRICIHFEVWQKPLDNSVHRVSLYPLPSTNTLPLKLRQQITHSAILIVLMISEKT